MTPHTKLRAVSGDPDALPVDPLADLYLRANTENTAALQRAVKDLATGLYSLTTDVAGDVWVVKADTKDPDRSAAQYRQGIVRRRRSPLGEWICVAGCTCPAYAKADHLNSELFRAGFEPFVLCKHGHILNILQARELNAQTSVTAAERFSLATASARKPGRAASVVGATGQEGR